MVPSALRAEDHAARPNAIGRPLAVAITPRPRLSWVLPVVRQGQLQVAYQVVAAAGDGDPRVDADRWDSGRVESQENAYVQWGGERLPAHSLTRWTVRVWDEAGEVSGWADPVELVTGPFTAADWTASWIKIASTHAARTVFTLPSKPVRAHLHLAGHGVVRTVLSGRTVNPDSCDPSSTALTRVVSRSYDVTAELRAGPQVFALVGGLGHYGHVLPAARVIAELVVQLPDGSVLRIGTNESWTHGPTSMVHDVPFYLEERDARITDDWANSQFDQLWPQVGSADFPHITITPDAGPPVIVVQELPAPPIGVGRLVFDVGQNIAGRSRVEIIGAVPGTRIDVVHGEKLDPQGQVDTLNIRLPWDRDRERQVVALTCAGGVDVIEPWFAVHGFRYVQVRGLPADADVTVTARVLHSDIAQTGRFASDDAKLDQLVTMAVAGQRNNTHGHPEDCPTREQAGWTGDAAVSAEAALSHLDMAGVYRNWLADVIADQRPDGGIPGVSPALQGEAETQPSDPVWGAAMTEIPRQLWRHTGDPDLILTNLSAMRAWCDYQLGTVEGGVVQHAGISFGADWLAPERTPPMLLQTAAVIKSLRALAELEAAAGNSEQSARRTTEADDLTRSARAVLRDPATEGWANNSQGALAAALASGLAEPEEQRSISDRIRADVHHRGDRVSTGFSATQDVVRVLGAADMGTALLKAVHQTEQPGIGSMLTEGPGTFWETWWIDDDNAGVASLNHIGLAAPFAAWIWTKVAGLEPMAPGFRRFRIAPWLSGPIRRVEFERDTVRGQIAFAANVVSGSLTVDVQVPVGATAVLTLPGSNLTVDGVNPSEHPYARTVGHDLELESGKYRVVAQSVGTPAVDPAIGGLDEVPVGETARSSLILPGGSSGWTIGIDRGWTATFDGADLIVGAPVDAAVNSTAEVALHRGSDSAHRTARAVRHGRWPTDTLNGPTAWVPEEGGAGAVLPGPYVCQPIWHGQVPGDVLEFSTPTLPPGVCSWTTLTLPEAADLTLASFVSAELDLCFADVPGRRVVPTLRIRSLDGTQRTGTVRPLPVCWNRVAVDVSDWGGRSTVVELSLGLEWLDQPESARGGYRPLDTLTSQLHFRLGDVRWTSAPRSW